MARNKSTFSYHDTYIYIYIYTYIGSRGRYKNAISTKVFWFRTDIIFIKRLFEYNGFNSHQYRTSFTNKHFQIKFQQIPNFCTIVIYFDIFQRFGCSRNL
jgi:hypothetical protein